MGTVAPTPPPNWSPGTALEFEDAAQAHEDAAEDAHMRPEKSDNWGKENTDMSLLSDTKETIAHILVVGAWILTASLIAVFWWWVFTPTEKAPAPVADHALLPKDVWLVMGGSNIDGRGNLYPKDANTEDGLWHWRDGAWQPLAQPFTDGEGYSIAGPFAREIRLSDDVGIIHVAKGGASIRDYAPGQDMFNRALTAYRACKLQGGNLRGIVYGMNLADAGMDPSEYRKRIDDIRSHFPDVPMVFIELRTDKSLSSELNPYHIVNGDDLPMYDGIHYDRWALQVLAKRCAHALIWGE